MAPFVIYGVVVWWLAFRLRGSWRASIPPLLGLAGVMAAAWLHGRLNEWSGGQINLPALRVVLYPYGAFILIVGLYIAWLPAPAIGRKDGRCHRCLYDLRGQPAGSSKCPECGEHRLLPGEFGTAAARIRRRRTRV